MKPEVKRVPAIDKCFAILDLLVRAKEPLGISEISQQLNMNKSTVFSIVHTLVDLNVLETQRSGKFLFGPRFYVLANVAGKRSALIRTVHPHLEHLSEQTGLSVFLGVRSDRRAILVDKVDSPLGIRVSSEIGFRMPTLAGAGIKAMLAQLPDEEVHKILARSELRQYTPHSITNKARYEAEISEARLQGVAYDREEYLEGMKAVAVPVSASAGSVQAAIWVVGLTPQLPDESFPELTALLRRTAEEINSRQL